MKTSKALLVFALVLSIASFTAACSSSSQTAPGKEDDGLKIYTTLYPFTTLPKK